MWPSSHYAEVLSLHFFTFMSFFFSFCLECLSRNCWEISDLKKWESSLDTLLTAAYKDKIEVYRAGDSFSASRHGLINIYIKIFSTKLSKMNRMLYLKPGVIWGGFLFAGLFFFPFKITSLYITKRVIRKQARNRDRKRKIFQRDFDNRAAIEGRGKHPWEMW